MLNNRTAYYIQFCVSRADGVKPQLLYYYRLHIGLDPTQMSNSLCSHLLYLRSAAVPGWIFFKCPAERKAVKVVCNLTDDTTNW